MKSESRLITDIEEAPAHLGLNFIKYTNVRRYVDLTANIGRFPIAQKCNATYHFVLSKQRKNNAEP